MKQTLEEHHRRNEAGDPMGGESHAIGMHIRWQDGPLGRGKDRLEPNGAFVETVIAAALGRLRFYQASRFECEENRIAIVDLEHALSALTRRTAEREARGVEGTLAP